MGNLGQSRLSAGSRFPERRIAPRFAFDARLEIIDPVAQRHITGRVTVLSEKGCFGNVQTPLTQRAVVHVQIVKDETIFETWARATPNHPDTESGVVLVFLDTPPEQAEVLAGWLDGLSAR